MINGSRKLRFLTLLLVFAAVFYVGHEVSRWQRWHFTHHRSWNSPDRQYIVNLYRNNIFGFIPAAPGGGSDAPGFVELIDAKTGDVLEETDIGMVQHLSHVSWTRDECQLAGRLPDWKLPREISGLERAFHPEIETVDPGQR